MTGPGIALEPTGVPGEEIARHNREAIEEIIRCVEDGTYCALLGPRLSGKTELLRFIDGTLAGSMGWTCIYIDLYATRVSTLQGFFADLMRRTVKRIAELTGTTLSVPQASGTSSAVFRGFLSDSVMQLGRDLVLILEHLEAVPTDLVQALLTSLRAAYMDQQTSDYRVTVVVSGALSLATLTAGESSPFRGIARRVFVGDLSNSQSEGLIAEQLTAAGINASKNARQSLLGATRGDPYLIRQICQRCVDLISEMPFSRLRARNVRQVLGGFLQDEVYGYAPLLEAARLIEEDPDLLRCVLMLLAYGMVPKGELPLPLSPDVDPLYLTGVVEQVGGNHYRIQNEIYRQFLMQHFHSGHVGHLLTMAGRWDSAIDYLEAGVKEGNEQSRSDLLPATINSMYASEDVGQAAHFLTRGLSAAFGVVDARVWHASSQDNLLRLVGRLGPKMEGGLWTSPEMEIQADRLEARAYRQARALRGRESGRHVWRAIPLLIPGRKPVGVVTVCDDLLGDQFVQQRERDLQLIGYLNQAARALQAVSRRRQELALAGRMQASLLPATLPDVAGWEMAAALRPARETSGDFYDFIPLADGRLGLVIADVADKGMGAALYMALARTLIRTYAVDHPDRPDLALRAANDRILADTESGLFVTVFYGILEPASGRLTYCNAGHHPPLLLQPLAGQSARAGDTVQALPGRCMALGVLEDTGWGHGMIEIPPGATLLLFTDGTVDAHNSQGMRLGNEGLLQAVQANLDYSAQDLQDALLARLQQFVGEEPQFDDITLMVVRRTG